jgi:Ca-activated chloride channel family protein
VEGEIRGGLVLLKLSRTAEAVGGGDTLRLAVSYEDRLGNTQSGEQTFELPVVEPGHYDSTGIRKGILLSRYASLLKTWITDERLSYRNEEPVVPLIGHADGIILPPQPEPELGEWEQRSIPLFVSRAYRKLFEEFQAYFAAEREALADEALEQEIVILDKLSQFGGPEPADEE